LIEVPAVNDEQGSLNKEWDVMLDQPQPVEALGEEVVYQILQHGLVW
jgi:hypothetical protein